MLDAFVKQHLHTDTDAQHGSSTRKTSFDDAAALHRVDAGHTRRKGTDAGHHETISIEGGIEVRCDSDIATRAQEGTLGRTQIAGTVVEYDYRGSRHVSRSGPAAMPTGRRR